MLKNERDERVGGVHVRDDQVSVVLKDLWMREWILGYS